MPKIDKTKCIGCGMCVSLCPEVFEISDDGKASVKSKKNPVCVKEATNSCPVSAISK